MNQTRPFDRAISSTVPQTAIFAGLTAALLVILYSLQARLGPDSLLLMALLYALIGLGLILRAHMTPSQATIPAANSAAQSVTMPSSADFDRDHLIMHMKVTVDGLVRAAYAINEVSSQQTASADDQATVIQHTNRMVGDFLDLSEQERDKVRQMNAAADDAALLSDNGQKTLQQSQLTLERIRESVNTIGQMIAQLARLTQRIDTIITSVSEIATQSNLLALNASIEAARAGAHGRGFAVVADEVRDLAAQSTQAADQIRTILGEIQGAMKETAEVTEIGLASVDEGIDHAQEANTAIIQLSEAVTSARGTIQGIYQVVLQQADGIEEISISMDRIDRITQQSLVSNRTAETVAANLTRLADDLQRTVGNRDDMADMQPPEDRAEMQPAQTIASE